MEIANKVAVITGGATGIGFALAKEMGKRGAQVVIAEPRQEKLQQAVATLAGEGVTAEYFVCDVTDLNQVEALAEFAWSTFGQVDIAINNAGIGQPRATVMDCDMQAVHATFDVNFFGVWHGCRVFGKRFAEQGTPAAIYNTASENAFFVAAPQMAAYVATKHAVLGLTDALREEVPDFVQVGAIIPGFVATDLTAQAGELAMTADEFAGIIVPQIEAGEFLAVSHAYNMEHINQRHQRVSRAYAQYAPRYEGDDEYDVRALLAKMSQS